MIYTVFLHLVIQIFIKFTQLSHSVRNAVPQILVWLWFFMSFAVNLQQSFVIGSNDVNIEAISLGTFGMVGSSATLIIAWDRDTDHITTNCANVSVFLAAINQVNPLHFFLCQVVCTLRPQYIARYMHELSDSLFLMPLLGYSHSKIRLSSWKFYMSNNVLYVLRGASFASYKKWPPWTGHSSHWAFEGMPCLQSSQTK